jgi:hypothetical protein
LVKKAWNSPWVRSGGFDYKGVSYVSRLSSLSLLSTLQSFSLLVLTTTITTCEFRPVPQLVSFTIELLRKVRLMAPSWCILRLLYCNHHIMKLLLQRA